MPIKIGGTLTQASSTKFPIVDSNDVKGGLMTTNTIEERNKILLESRKPGMLCYVVSDKKFYQLTDGINNINWEEVKFKQELKVTPSVVFKVSPNDGYFGKNQEQVENPILTANINPGSFKAFNINFLKGNMIINTQGFNEDQYIYTYQDKMIINDNTNYKIVIEYDDEGESKQVISKELIYDFIYPSYLGVVSEPELTEANRTTLDKLLIPNKNTEYSYDCTTSYMCFAYPFSYGEIESIKDADVGFELKSGWNKTIKTIDDIQYYVYLSRQCSVINYKINFK